MHPTDCAKVSCDHLRSKSIARRGPDLLELDPVTQRATEIEIDSEVGLVFTHSQATARCRKRGDSVWLRSALAPQQDVVHVARIPLVIWQRLQRLGITRDPKALNAWLNSRECRLFRTDDGRKL